MLEEKKSLVYSFDLTPVYHRLVEVEGWRPFEAKAAIEQYRNFVFLVVKHYPLQLTPSLDIDEVWHAHILHTRLYRDFCQKVFSERESPYLDHNPRLTTESVQAYRDAFQCTQKLYKQEFGECIYAVRLGWFGRAFSKLQRSLIWLFPSLERLAV